MRWRDRPREALRHAQGWHLYYPILTGGAWVIAAEYLADAVTGHRNAAGSDWRLGTALFGLGSLAVASGLTWLAILYLRRPLRPEDDAIRDTAPTPDDVRLRNEAEESARRYR